METTLDQIFHKIQQLFLEKKYKEVIELLTDDLLSNYNNPALYTWLSRAHGNLNELDSSLIYAQKSIDIDPSFSTGYRVRGISWFVLKEYNKAIEDFSKAIELDPSDPLPYYNRGKSWDSIEDHIKAIEDFSKAIELDPSDPDFYFDRAIAWDSIKEHRKAIEDFNEANLLDPSEPYAYFNRGIAWESIKEYDKAIEDLKTYIKLTNDHNEYYSQVAQDKIRELQKRIENTWYDEIDDIINQIKQILLFSDPYLSHYTSLSSAKIMVLDTKSKFRLSEGAFLNDTSEGRELFKYLSFETTKRTDDETISELFVERPFIGSFVAESKHNDLALWRMYGKEAQAEAKGCALTINKTIFIDNLKDKIGPTESKEDNKSQGGEQFTFYNVAYLLKDKFTIPGKDDIFNEKLNILMMNLKGKIQSLIKEQKSSITKLLNDIAYLFKSADYQYENEVRLVVQGVGFNKVINTDLIPPRVFIELVNIVPSLHKITLGPKVERADEWAAAFNYHIKQQLTDKTDKVEIIISHLPFK